MTSPALFELRNRRHLAALSAFCHAAAAELNDTDHVSWLPSVMDGLADIARPPSRGSGKRPTRYVSLDLVLPIDRLIDFYGPVWWDICYSSKNITRLEHVDLAPHRADQSVDYPSSRKRRPKRVKGYSETTWFSHGAHDPACRPVEELREKLRDCGVIDPLTQPDPEATERDQHRRDCGQDLEHTSARQQERHEARGHEDFVPVVERKLVQRALHRLGSWLLEVASR